ncbi:MAG: AAA family ATPase [Gammaproteobacteria bacterium]|nr:AAA family ATPase [Gammaproteobacteria bacterium]
MSAGRIILLNGSSSAGKTTLARAIQVARREPWFHLALDQFRDGMPPAYRGLNSPEGTPGARGLNVVPIDHDGGRVTAIRFGDVGRRMLQGMHRAIAAFAAAGNDVIIDDLFLETDTLDDYLDALDGFWVLFVAVRAPLDVVQEREASRPGRFPGTALSHFEAVHAHGIYDLEIDTRQNSPEACAAAVSARLDAHAPPTAFDELRALKKRG